MHDIFLNIKVVSLNYGDIVVANSNYVSHIKKAILSSDGAGRVGQADNISTKGLGRQP